MWRVRVRTPVTATAPLPAEPSGNPPGDLPPDEATAAGGLAEDVGPKPLDIGVGASQAVEMPNLGGRAVRGVLITTGFSVFWEIAGGLGALITARFLRPQDYALITVAALALRFVGALQAFNLDTRLVQVQEDPGDAYDYGFTLYAATGILYVLIALVAAPIASRAYGASVLIPICLILSLNRLIGTFGWPAVYFARELRWWTQRLIGSAGGSAQVVLTLVLAIRGFGVWSLVYGQLAGTIVPTALTWALAPRRPRLRLRVPRRYLWFFFSFGWPMWVGGIVGVAAANGILKEVEFTLGLAVLGYMNMAVGLGDRIDRAEQILGSVMFPVLSRTRDEGRLRKGYELTQKTVLIWAVPAGLGLAVFAPDVVRVVLSPKWTPIVPLLRVEGIGEVLNAVATMWRMFYMVHGENRPGMRVGLQINIFMLLAIGVLSAAFGYQGIVITIFVAAVLSLYQRRRYTLAMFPGMPVIRTALPLILAGVASSGVTILMGASVTGLPYIPGLGLRLVAFLGMYALLVILLERSFLREGLVLLRHRGLAQASAAAPEGA